MADDDDGRGAGAEFLRRCKRAPHRRAHTEDIDREIRAVVTESAEFAQASPEPDPSELMTDIYIEA